MIVRTNASSDHGSRFTLSSVAGAPPAAPPPTTRASTVICSKGSMPAGTASMRHLSVVMLDDMTVYPRARKACTDAALIAAGFTSSGSVQRTVPNECVPTTPDCPCAPVVVLHPGRTTTQSPARRSNATSHACRFVWNTFGFNARSMPESIGCSGNLCPITPRYPFAAEQADPAVDRGRG